MIDSRIGIIGLGRLGGLLAEILRRDCTVIGFDPAFAGTASLAEAAGADVVIFCVPISRFESALTEALLYIREGALVLDVCSVKVRPAEIMARLLPPSVRMLPTHPMFGPDAWKIDKPPFPFVLCPTDRTPAADYERVANYLEQHEFSVVRMTPDEHDRTLAYTLCLTHLLGRAVGRLDLQESPSDTASFRALLEISHIACNDTYELFRDMQLWNPYAAEMRQRLIGALTDIERELAS